jgi:hypothetical protein
VTRAGYHQHMRVIAPLVAVGVAILAGCAARSTDGDCSVRFVSWDVRDWRALSGDDSRLIVEMLRTARPCKSQPSDGLESMISRDVCYVLDVTHDGVTDRVRIIGTAALVRAPGETDASELQILDEETHRRLLEILRRRSQELPLTH